MEQLAYDMDKLLVVIKDGRPVGIADRTICMAHLLTIDHPYPCLQKKITKKNMNVTDELHARTHTMQCKTIMTEDIRMNAGLRRLGADRLDGEQHGGEGRGPEQPEPAGLRGHRRRQEGGGGAVPQDGVLRRHPGVRGAGQHRAGGEQPDVQGPRGAARRAGVQGHGCQQQPPLAALHRRRARWQLHAQEPHRRGHGGALRRAHRRPLPLLLLHQPPLRLQQRQRRRPHHQLRLRPPAAGHLPVQHQPVLPQHHHRHGPHHARAARQQVLRRPRQQPRPLHVRPGATHQRHAQEVRRRLRQERKRVEDQVRKVHGQDGQYRRAHGHQGGDQAQLQGHQQRQQQLWIISASHGNRLCRGIRPRCNQLAATISLSVEDLVIYCCSVTMFFDVAISSTTRIRLFTECSILC
jgi:hypothetical protein